MLLEIENTKIDGGREPALQIPRKLGPNAEVNNQTHLSCISGAGGCQAWVVCPTSFAWLSVGEVGHVGQAKFKQFAYAFWWRRKEGHNKSA